MNRDPFIAHSELTNEIYIVAGKEKYRVTEQVIHAVKAIKALEQEPFINKPCISSRVCEHDKQKVLEKIRAEIAELWHQYPMGHDYELAINRCLKVIDKYKAETEDA